MSFHSTTPGDTQEKVWGLTTCFIFTSCPSESHYLQIKKGGFCSEHRHLQKINRFYVIKGSLDVVEYNAFGREKTTKLTAGSFVDVPAGVWHKFECLDEDCECIESYWCPLPNLEQNDIERRTNGGIYA